MYGSPTSSPTPTPTPTSSPISSPTPTPTPISSPTPSPTPVLGTKSPYGPTAVISNQNGTTYQTNSPITLGGSASTGGYDGQSVCPISNYAWLVQYSNSSVFGAFSGPLISINVNIVTTLKVILVVTAQDVNTPANTQYTNTSTTYVWINVESPQQLTQIDVFTNKGGIGQNVTSGPFGPQELIQLYANVTYNGAPVADKEVTFTVLDPTGNVIAVNTALTNATGFAYQQYRTPWTGSTGNPDFGKWTVLAYVEISQVVVNDTVSFDYNYLVTTNGITLPASVERGSPITINVTLQSTDNSILNPTVTITIYDQNQVPVDNYITTVNNITLNDSVVATVTIPTWAFVGQATVYVNVLTANPTACGTPYSPEQIATFQILQ